KGLRRQEMTCGRAKKESRLQHGWLWEAIPRIGHSLPSGRAFSRLDHSDTRPWPRRPTPLHSKVLLNATATLDREPSPRTPHRPLLPVETRGSGDAGRRVWLSALE